VDVVVGLVVVGFVDWVDLVGFVCGVVCCLDGCYE